MFMYIFKFDWIFLRLVLHFRTKRIMSSVRVQNFVTRLKSKNFEIRKRAARDLNLYVINFNIYFYMYKHLDLIFKICLLYNYY